MQLENMSLFHRATPCLTHLLFHRYRNDTIFSVKNNFNNNLHLHLHTNTLTQTQSGDVRMQTNNAVLPACRSWFAGVVRWSSSCCSRLRGAHGTRTALPRSTRQRRSAPAVETLTMSRQFHIILHNVYL